MNIFALSDDPSRAAQEQCNKHVVKMTLESTQLLCSALYINGIPKQDLPYKPTHWDHPSTAWTAATPENFAWLYQHALALSAEYTRRYNKIHRCDQVISSLKKYVKNVNVANHTPFVQTMPAVWKNADSIIAYKCFYIAEKSRFAKWAPRATPPSWWPFAE